MDAPFPVDPAVALPKPSVVPLIPGPAHGVQYVIEIVGPHSVPASAASMLLNPDWYAALGQPEIYAMAPSDTCWTRISPAQSGSLDSLALAWDVLSPSGALSSASANHLFQVATEFAEAVGRRAIPLPIAADIDRTAKALVELQESLDIGCSLALLARSGAVSEEALWQQSARLGLEFSAEGSFDWRSPDHPSPLFSVTPIGESDAFSLAGVHSGRRFEGVTIGFSVPLCPDPMLALTSALRAVDVYVAALDMIAFDQNQRPLTPDVRDDLRRSMNQAIGALDRAGLRPGSAAALKLFA